MSMDIIADALNQIRNARNARKTKIVIRRSSKLLLKIFEIMERGKYLDLYKYNPENGSVDVVVGNVSECKAIKPRLYIKKTEIFRYLRRYLPAKDYGVVVISTNKGIMTHEEAIEKEIGGSLIAYFY
ncbi:MAG: 30S ribosomal protein S8 [Nanoarchaeota archaeon]